MLDDISYAMAFRQNLTNVLRIDDKYITNGSFHAAGLGYVSWLEIVLLAVAGSLPLPAGSWQCLAGQRHLQDVCWQDIVY